VYKCLLTLSTFELLYSSVGRDVSRQVRMNTESLATKATFERPLPCVGPSVAYHVRMVSKGFATVVAFEGFVSCVGPHVLFQCPGSAELLTALLTLDPPVVLWSPYMLSGMGCQLSAVGERLVTLVTVQALLTAV